MDLLADLLERFVSPGMAARPVGEAGAKVSRMTTVMGGDGVAVEGDFTDALGSVLVGLTLLDSLVDGASSIGGLVFDAEVNLGWRGGG